MYSGLDHNAVLKSRVKGFGEMFRAATLVVLLLGMQPSAARRSTLKLLPADYAETLATAC